MELYGYDSSLAGTSVPKYSKIIQKLTGHCPEILSGQERSSTQQLLDSIPRRRQDILLLSLAQSGGAFRKQLQYLGLFADTSQFKQIVSLMKKSYAFLGNVVEQRNYNGKNFYYLSEDSAALADSILDNAHSLKKSIPSLSSSHEGNIEHAAGFNDYFMYILGNNHYPPLFRLRTEEAVRSDDDAVRYCVADAVNTTIYGGVSLIDDFIEVHTGTQRMQAIAGKLEAYINHLECLNKNVEQTHTYETADIIFLVHPAGICSNYKSVPGRRTAAVNGSYNHSDAAMLFNITCLLLQEAQAKGFANGFYSLYHILRDCHGMYEPFLSRTKLTFTQEQLSVICCLLAMVPGLSDAMNRNELLGYFGEILSHNSIPCGYRAGGYTKESKDFYNTYHTQCEMIENAIRNELPESYPIASRSLKNAVLKGFSIYTVYGGDMYDSFLGVHPHFSGAYIAILQYLYAYGIIEGEINHVLPGASVQLSQKHNIVLKNYYGIENEGSLTGVFIEDLTTDYGARIRVREFMTHTEFPLTDIRLICIVESAADAYMYLADYCYNLMYKNGKRLSAKCLAGNIGIQEACAKILDNQLNLPIFITKPDIKAAMNGLPELNGMFVFYDTDTYRNAAKGYGKPDRKFPAFFDGIIKNNEFGGDILFLN